MPLGLAAIAASRTAFDWYRRRLDASDTPPATLVPGRALEEVLADLPGPHPRTRLVLSLDRGAADAGLRERVVIPGLRAAYRSEEETLFPRIRVRLYAGPRAERP